MSPANHFTDDQKTAIVNAIRQAENATSGEIRVHIENHCRKPVLDRAADVFAALKMHKTALRNGVLIYLALQDHKMAILGDAGINAKVPPDFWENIKNHMIEHFRQGRLTEGLVQAILSAGDALRAYFPHQVDDRNELPDDISFL